MKKTRGKLTLNSFKADSFKNLEFREKVNLGNINIFIGPNGSGKSNFISCLKFLKESVSSNGDSQNISSYEKSVSNMGGVGILDKGKESPGRVSFQYEFYLSDFKDATTLDIKLLADRTSSIVRISEELLYHNAISDYPEPFHVYAERPDLYTEHPYLYKFHDKVPGSGMVSVYNKLCATHIDIPNVPANSLGLASLPELLENSLYPPEQTPVYKVRREIIDNVSKWSFYNSNDMSLNEIRLSEPKIGQGDIFLSPSGDNLPLVLDNLTQRDIGFEDSLNIAMRSILPRTRKVRPSRPGRLSLTVEWYFEGIREPFYLNEMSDGTVRMLCWAIVLLSPTVPDLLVIDEPELGLHVSWMPILAEWIKKASTRSQVFVSTHSPDLLDHFTDELENVFCFENVGKERFSMERLSKKPLEDKLEEGWELGDLYRTGDPGVGGWPW